MDMWKKWMALGLVTLLLSAAGLCGSAAAQQRALAARLIRLHVVAASDDAADQARKLRVRDVLLPRITALTADCLDAEAAAAVLGTWSLDKAEIKEEDAEDYKPAEVENTRTYVFNEDGTGSVQYADWSDTFDYAIQGEVLTLAMDTQGTLEMYQATFNEDGALQLVRINNDGSMQDLRETFVTPVP